jgi:hypothetical protein
VSDEAQLLTVKVIHTCVMYAAKGIVRITIIHPNLSINVMCEHSKFKTF